MRHVIFILLFVAAPVRAEMEWPDYREYMTALASLPEPPVLFCHSGMASAARHDPNELASKALYGRAELFNEPPLVRPFDDEDARAALSILSRSMLAAGVTSTRKAETLKNDLNYGFGYFEMSPDRYLDMMAIYLTYVWAVTRNDVDAAKGPATMNLLRDQMTLAEMECGTLVAMGDGLEDMRHLLMVRILYLIHGMVEADRTGNAAEFSAFVNQRDGKLIEGLVMSPTGLVEP